MFRENYQHPALLCEHSHQEISNMLDHFDLSLTSGSCACLLATILGPGLLTDAVGGVDVDEAEFSNLKQWKIVARSFRFAQGQQNVCVPCPCLTDAALWNKTCSSMGKCRNKFVFIFLFQGFFGYDSPIWAMIVSTTLENSKLTSAQQKLQT